MIDPEREELLSAFLDGEVSPEERARVEQWLAESDELRHLRDELVAIRGDLQALPRRTVGHDLAAVVMHRSTMAVPDPSNLSAPAAGSTPSHAITPSTAAGGESSLGNIVTEWWNRGSQGRRFLWPVLAVAAALVILVFDARQRPNEFEVAQAPEAAPAEPQDELEDATAAAGQPSIGGVPEMSAAEMPVPEASVSSALDSGAPASAPPAAEMRRSAEMTVPNTERSKRDFGAMREAAPANRGARTPAADGAGAPAPMSAPAQVAQPADAFFGKRAEESGPSPAVQTIVCPVTPQYLKGREFEKLLDANKVRWHAVPISPELQIAPASPRTAPREALGKTPLQSLYFLQVNSEQANAILSKVPQDDRLREGNRIAASIPQQQPKAAANDKAGGVQVLLVAPSAGAVPAAK